MQLLLLNVSNNQLKFLPESIGSCYSLEELQANGTYRRDSLVNRRLFSSEKAYVSCVG